MAIIASVLGTGFYETTSADPTVTNEDVTPPANTLIVFGFWTYGTFALGGVPVTGCNLAWTQVSSTVSFQGGNLYVFRGSGASPTTGKISVDFTGGSDKIIYGLAQVANSNPTTNDGVVQSAQVADKSTTLSAFADGGNGTIVVGMMHDPAATATVGAASGYSLIADIGANAPSAGVHLGITWSSAPDTGPEFLYSGGTGDETGVIVAMEITAGAVGYPKIVSVL